jgi:pimeloyl-ACP methyl ester carboxylesterase
VTEVRERELIVDGLRTVLAEAGPADADEAVVFVHGNPGSARDWQDLMGRTGEFARSLAMDMPCFGRADKPRDFALPVEGHAHFLTSALNDLGVKRAHLVLHDFGGPWGLGWAGLNQDAFASVVLIDTGILIGFEQHPTGKLWARPVVGELVMAATTRGAFTRALLRGDARPLPRAYIDQMYDTYDRATRRTVLRLYRNRTDDDVLRAASQLFNGLDRPALVLWGAKDPFVLLHHAEQQRESFPRAEVVVLEDSGHWPFADDPEGTANAVVPFVRGQVGVSPAG